MSLSWISVWSAGILNGYKKDEGQGQGLPTSYKYTLMSVVSGLQIVKGLGLSNEVHMKPASLLASLFVGIPLMVGATFCTGTFLGKSVYHTFPKIENSKQPFTDLQ